MEFYIMQPVTGSAAPKAIGILQNIESVVWSNYVDETGSVEIKAAITDYNLEMLQRGNYIRKPYPVTLRVGETWATKQDVTMYEICEITDVEIDSSNKTLSCSGKMLDCMLETRINAAYTVIDGTKNFFDWFPSFITQYTTQSAYRALPMTWRPGTLAGAGTATIKDCSLAYNTLAEIIETVRSQNEGTGEHSSFNVRVFHSDGDWAGATISAGNCLVPFWSWDRTTGEEAVVYRYDKDDMDNIVINEGNNDWSNVAFVAGEGEGTERTTTWYPSNQATIKGVGRRELYVDARDLKSEDYTTSSQYVTALRNRGKEKLVSEVTTIEFDVVRSDYEYGKDFYLGDNVGLVIREIDAMLKLPVSGAVESFDENGYSISLEFGQPKESFAKRIKKRLK